MGSGVTPPLETPGQNHQGFFANQEINEQILLAYVTHEQYAENQLKEKRSIVHSYRLAKYITVRTPATDLTGSLPADLWRNAILRRASRLDAFSGYPVRT